MAKSYVRYILLALLALSVLAARVNLSPAQQVSPAAVQQQDTPVPGDREGDDLVPQTGDDSYGELSERLAEREAESAFSSNLLFLGICGAAFLVLVIGLLTRARFHRFPPREE